MLQFSPIFFLFCAGIATLVYYEIRRSGPDAADPDGAGVYDVSGRDKKLDARQTNERIRISATYANNLSVGVLIGGLVGPSVKGDYPNPIWYLVLVFVALCLHLGARAIVGTLKSED